MNPFRSLRDYEEFVYTLAQRFSSIVTSTLVVARRGGRMVTTTGVVAFARGYRLVVKERMSLESGSLVLDRYGYEVWHGDDKLYWYDSQPHPHDITLASTSPHHKHIPPDIKHHRIPAPGLTFAQPNLPLLIAEIEERIRASV